MKLPRFVDRRLSHYASGVLTFLAVVVASHDAEALVGHCVTWSLIGNTSGQHVYKINTSSFSSALGMASADVEGAVMAGADVWTEKGRAGFFQYTGTTSLTDLPATYADCKAQGINYSIVVAEATCNSWAARTTAR